jgi:hypothetical protein
MGAHLDLPSNARQSDKAYKRQQVYQACFKSLRFFWIGTEKYNLSRRLGRGNTRFWHIQTYNRDGDKKGCHMR